MCLNYLTCHLLRYYVLSIQNHLFFNFNQTSKVSLLRNSNGATSNSRKFVRKNYSLKLYASAVRWKAWTRTRRVRVWKISGIPRKIQGVFYPDVILSNYVHSSDSKSQTALEIHFLKVLKKNVAIVLEFTIQKKRKRKWKTRVS